MGRTNFSFFLFGGLLLAIPGLTATDARASWMAPMAVGLILLIVGTVRARLEEPLTALTLLLTLNIAYWLSHFSWLLKRRIVEGSVAFATDPFSGPVTVWLLLLLGVLFYQVVVFVRGVLAGGRPRAISVVGLIGLVIQMALTTRVLWDMVQSV